MLNRLRLLVNAIVGKVPGKTSLPDTATRMAMDADFTYRKPRRSALPLERQRRDGRLVDPAGRLADVAFLQELIRIIQEAQERDAEDERRQYRPMPAVSHSIVSTTASRSWVAFLSSLTHPRGAPH
jgi:hypothetical protein